MNIKPEPDKKIISILPQMVEGGGPFSFYNRFVQGLEMRGYQLALSPMEDNCTSLLVIGGTRRIDLLLRAKQRGIPIVQRLNGMNWMHRKQRTPLTYYLQSEMNNRLLATIRRYIADHIVYQSEFARSWWNTVHRDVPASSSVVYNGVELEMYTPEGSGEPPKDHIRILLVEANVAGGYEKGLENAIQLAQMLDAEISQPVELMVVGRVPDSLRTYWSEKAGIWITWCGVVPREKIPEIDRSAHMLFSSDLNAACPNSVIEALACGLPVIGFATGSLPELVDDEVGRVVPYGANYWNLEPPVVSNLTEAAIEILKNLPAFRKAARKKAEEKYSVEWMLDCYLAKFDPRVPEAKPAI